MAEELSNLMERISFTEYEEAEVMIPFGEFQEVVSYGQTCAVAKLVADRMMSMETIKTTLWRWGKLQESPNFKVLGENLFLIEFFSMQDKKRILDSRPWVIEGSLLLVEDFDGSTAPTSYTFDKAAFWVRMINLPLGCMGQAIGRRIGETVGVVEIVDTDAKRVGWGEFLRVKILLDLAKPLPRGRKINIMGKTEWITFKYERLPKFCFYCGVICHGKTGCSRKSALRQELPQYGAWMRAASPTRRVEKNVYKPAPVREVRGQSRSRQPKENKGGIMSELGDEEEEDPVTAGNPNSHNGNSQNKGTNQGDSGGFTFGKNPFVTEDAKRGRQNVPVEASPVKFNANSKKKGVNLTKAGKGKISCKSVNDTKVGLSGSWAEGGKVKEFMGPTEPVRNNRHVTRYSGPLFSDVEKTLHEEQLGGQGGELHGRGGAKWPGGLWKRKAEGILEQTDETRCTQKICIN
jgi:hypothetical protein